MMMPREQVLAAANFIADGKFYVEARVGSQNYRNTEYHSPCRVIYDGNSRNEDVAQLLKKFAIMLREKHGGKE